MPLAQNAIPQLVIQEVYIPQGNNNNVQQIINQDLIVYVLEIPELEEIAGISKFIQTDDDIGNNNQVSQNTLQTFVDFPLFSNNDTISEFDDNADTALNLNFNEFINNDGVLETVQFSNQQIYVEGNNNSLDLYAEQIVYDLSWYDRYGLDSDYGFFDEKITFDDFLADFAGDYALDSLQVGVQDTILSGGGNNVIQQLDQTVATFIFLDQDFATELREESANSSPIQFAFQESFLDTNNNTIEQNIIQNIELDFSFGDEFDDKFEQLTGEELNNPDFVIDDFILPILENTIEDSPLFQNYEVLANQNNLQNLDILGDDNTDIKDSSQIVVLGETDNQELVLGSPRDDTFIVGVTDNFDGLQDLVRLGNGDDRLDLSNAFVDLDIAPFLIPTNTTVRGEGGDDQIIAYRGDEVFGDNGNDWLQTAEGGGENIFEGGRGNDTIMAGINDTVFGNNGDDILMGNDGDEILDGGDGSDRLEGSNGNDTYNVDDSSDQVIEALDGGTDLVITTIDYTLPNHVENLTLTGNGTREGKGNELNNIITAENGDNTLLGEEGDDRFILAGGINSVDGGEGIDTVQIDQAQADVGAISKNGDTVNLGTDNTLSNVEFIEFSDVTLAVDTLQPVEPVEPSEINTILNRFQNEAIPGTFLFATEEESRSIRQNFPNFVEEGKAFAVSLQPGDGLVRFNRFQNQDISGTFLFATEAESQSIRQNFPNFIEEGIAFYAYGANTNQGNPLNRFQNQNIPGTFIFATEQESQNIRQNFPNFIEEGIAFETVIG